MSRDLTSLYTSFILLKPAIIIDLRWYENVLCIKMYEEEVAKKSKVERERERERERDTCVGEWIRTIFYIFVSSLLQIICCVSAELLLVLLIMIFVDDDMLLLTKVISVVGGIVMRLRLRTINAYVHRPFM